MIAMLSADELDRAIGVAKRVSGRKARLFSRCPQVGFDDLVQQALLAILKAHSRFDPRRAKATTFLYRASSCELLDLWRVQSRSKMREPVAARPEEFDPIDTAGELEEGETDLAGWVERVRATAKAMFKGALYRPPGSRKHYRISTVAALALLMLRLDLPIEGIPPLLKNRPELLPALGFRHMPPRAYWAGLADLIQPRHRQLAGALAGSVE